jgi:hypothetical protein
MKPRLIILIVVLVVVAVVAAVKRTSQPKETNEVTKARDLAPTVEGQSGFKKALHQISVPGDEPPEEPSFDVDIKVDQTEGKQRLRFYITEEHGYFVETLRMNLYYLPDEAEQDEAIFVTELFINKYLRANDTLEYHTELTPVEMNRIGGDMGTDDNWLAEIIYYHAVREEDPPPSWEGYETDQGG